MAKVAPFDAVGRTIRWLTDRYMKKQVKGVIVITLDDDGDVEMTATGNLSIIEQFGLLEAGKQLMCEEEPGYL